MGNYFCKLKLCDSQTNITKITIKKKSVKKNSVKKKSVKKKYNFKNFYKTSPGPPVFLNLE